jgi:hypothetical protein
MVILKQTTSGDGLATKQGAKSLICGMLRAEPLHWVCIRRVAFRDLDEIPLVAFPDGYTYRKAALAALAKRAKKRRWELFERFAESAMAATGAAPVRETVKAMVVDRHPLRQPPWTSEQGTKVRLRCA